MFRGTEIETWRFKKEIMTGKFEVDMDALKKKQLEILVAFISCCEKLNLRYFLSYGTLIGAIRHKGFIPWDDDIDISMPRKDYEFFVKNAKDYMPSNYFVQTIESDPQYALNFAKLRDSNTTLIEKHVINIDINHGVFIDIFPLDGYRKGHNKMLDLRVKDNPIFEEPDKNIISNTINNINKKMVYKLGEALPNKLKTDLSKLAVPKDNLGFDECDYVVCSVDSFYILPIKREFFGKGIKVPFENIFANAPEKYDEYLKVLYGDYMQLPPEDQREAHHNFHFVDVNKGFREYGEYRRVKKWIKFKENL